MTVRHDDIEIEEEEFLDSIKDWPDHVKEIALKYPAYKCWRSTEDPEYHYCIIDYAHDRATREVTVTLVHGSGTKRAGIATFGQAPEQLIECKNCGGWEPPTLEEKEATLLHINDVRRARGLPPIPGAGTPGKGSA